MQVFEHSSFLNLKLTRSFTSNIKFKSFKMAFLKEDSAFTHVIAIDFGTGASG